MFAYSVVRDWAEGVWLITLEGELGLATHPAVRKLIEKCLADDPVAIIVDLRKIRSEGRLLFNLLATERRRSERRRVPLVYVADDPLASRIKSSPGHRFIDVVSSYDEALQHARSRPFRPWLHFGIEPDPLGESQARYRIGEACLDWGLPNVLHPARVVVSELVANAIQHAGTAIEVTASLAQGLLRIRVHDGSPERPVLRRPAPLDSRAPLDLRGQGLRRVAALATSWGCTATDNGKIVWATLDIT